jgi:uncharacterized protein (DUF362 family)
MSRFVIEPLGDDAVAAVRRVAEGLDLAGGVGDAVFLKPNFTYPFPKAGVTTTRPVLEAVVQVLSDLGCGRICIGEGEGGYNAFAMDETFAAFSLDELTARYGVEVVNASNWPSLEVRVEGRRGTYDVHLPKPLYEEFDSFISLPVPKVHCMTGISGAVKNEWGIVQDQMRLAFHCAFEEIITEVVDRLPNPYALVDGTFGLTRNGPMIEGETIDLGWVAGADDLWLADAVLCRIMDVPLRSVAHLRWGDDHGRVPALGAADLPDDLDRYLDDRFYLKRNLWNRVAKLTWYSPRLNHLVYFSKASSALHKVMYSIREKPDELSARGVDWQ